jgi:hypothetical protein
MPYPWPYGKGKEETLKLDEQQWDQARAFVREFFKQNPEKVLVQTQMHQTVGATCSNGASKMKRDVGRTTSGAEAQCCRKPSRIWSLGPGRPGVWQSLSE